MRCLNAALLFALAGLLPAQTAPSGPASDAKALETALRLRLRGDEAGAQALVRPILERQPDNMEVRLFLGHEFFRGRWRLPEEVALLRRAAEQRNAADQTAAAAAPAAKETATAPETPPTREKDPAAAAMAALRPGLARAQQEPVIAAAYGLFDLRLQWVQNQGFETVPVSFGNGTGRIQLPRTQSVSFNGAAWLPLGFGP
jgi:hypothetical protein